MSKVKSIISRHNKAQIGKPLNPPEESRTTVIAGSRILAHLKEIVMCGTLSIKQRSSPHSQKKATSDLAIEHLKNVTEITHALSQTKDTKM